MKKYAGEEFLNRLYKDLVHSEEVKHTAKGANKNEDLAIYLERLERITNEARDKERLDLLKHFYYKKYVINEEEVPESYFENLEQIALERGYGHIKYDDNTKKEEINSIISEQKASLDSWLDYFISDDTKHYPMWFKYYVFQNVMKIGYFDKEKNAFTKRTNSTVKPFIEINREAVSMLYDELSKYLNKQDITDIQLEQLIKNGSFIKIYSYIERKLAQNKSQVNENLWYSSILGKINIIKTASTGKWKKYNRGSDPKILFNDIHGKRTGWCTAGGLETASAHLIEGDFYVYFTQDSKGDYVNPRIAIRMDYNKIAEIRGIAEHQNLESEMEYVVERKLDEFPDKDEYKKKVDDMKKLTLIYNKHKNNEELSKEELTFLYEIDDSIIGFGYEKDPRIKEIKLNRSKRRDFAKIFNCKEEELSLTKEEFLRDKTKIHYGDLILSNIKKMEGLVLPKLIIGNLDLDRLNSSKGLILPEYIKGNLNLSGLTSAEGLILPKQVDGNVILSSLKSAKGLVFPEQLRGNLDLSGLTSLEDLNLPEYLKKRIIINSIKDVNYIHVLRAVTGIQEESKSLNYIILPETDSNNMKR